MANSTPLHKDLLKVLAKAKPSLRRAILREADKALVFSICEICDNTLNGNVPLKDSEKKQLRKHKKIIRLLAERRGSWKKKKHQVQKGGAFIPLLLSLLAPTLGKLIFGT